MPRSKKSQTAHGLEISDFEQLYHDRYDYADPILIELPGRHVLVGYLVQDDHCSNPVEDCDGMGKILNLGWDWGDQRSEGLGMLGLDSDGKIRPDLEAAEEELRFHVRRLDLIISPEEIERRVEYFPDRDDWLEAKAIELFAAGMNLHYVFLYYRDYGSGGSRYAVDCLATQWDFSNGCLPGAIWYPDAALKEELKRFSESEQPAQCLVYAQQAVEEVNKWLAGDCFGVVTELFWIDEDGTPEQIEEDSCWGYVGQECAEKELGDRTAAEAEHFRKTYDPHQHKDQLELTLQLS